MICIVIPVHNRKNFTRECLRSLEIQTIHVDYIIVVDAGSTDGTKEMLYTEFPDVILISVSATLFWTATINRGIRAALALKADYVLTLNNDTIAFPNFVEKMMMHADQSPPVLLGALDIDMKSKKPYYGGERFHWRSGASIYLLNILKKDEQHGLHEVSLFPARGLFIPHIVFETIGLFDEQQLPHYMADYDFTQRARNKGFKIYCNYDAKLYTYPDEGGDHKIRERKTMKNYLKHLFSIKGGGNLRNFTIYTLRNCPPVDVVFALLSGYTRRIGGFWIK